MTVRHYRYDSSTESQAPEPDAYLDHAIRAQIILSEMDRDEDLALKMWGGDDLGIADIRELMAVAEGRCGPQEMFAVLDVADDGPDVMIDQILGECGDNRRVTLVGARGIDHRTMDGLPRYAADQRYLLVLFAAHRPLSPEADVRWACRGQSTVAVFESARPGLGTQILEAIDTRTGAFSNGSSGTGNGRPEVVDWLDHNAIPDTGQAVAGQADMDLAS